MRPRSWRIDECLSKVSFTSRSKSCFCLPIQKAFFAGLMAFPFGSFRLEFALAVLARWNLDLFELPRQTDIMSVLQL